MIEVKKGIRINEKSITFQAVQSSGPGGQHVNKVSSKVILSLPLEAVTGITENQKVAIRAKLKMYFSADTIKISSQKHRSQYSNKIDATDKLILLLQKALKEKKPRYKTKVPKAVKEKRLKEKSIRSQIKKSRNFKQSSGE